MASNKLIPIQILEWYLIQTGHKALCDDKSIEGYGYSYQAEKQVKYRQGTIVTNLYTQQIFPYG